MAEQKTVSKKEVHDWVMVLFSACEQQLTPTERKEQQKYADMVSNHNDKIFLCRMLDETSQIRDRKKLAKRIKELIEQYGIPEFFNAKDRFLFKLYLATIGIPGVDAIAIPVIKKRLRTDTAAVCIDEAPKALTKHLKARANQEIGQNVNLLGEVVLGNNEADTRYEHYLEALENPDINYISVKITGIYAQTHALNYEESFPELIRRMSALYQKAIDFPYIDKHGVSAPKFVNLDMEEYKDFHLTKELFFAVLNKPEFKNYKAGIVVQTYLPDAYDFQTELLEFAHKRMKSGGAPIKMRLVKGCNLDMENVIASIRGWSMPCHSSKVEVDANYLCILERALLSENTKVLHVGVAGHNLYSIAYAFLLAKKYNTPVTEFCFEMLEGMANHLWRAQKDLGNYVLLYAPVVKDEHFLNAVSYLVRRLDENTGPENFLAHAFDLKPGTETWNFLSNQFAQSYDMKGSLFHGSKRRQNRNEPHKGLAPTWIMENEPDTDFDLIPNKRWIEGVYDKWMKKVGDETELIPVQIGSEAVITDKKHIYFDRCQNDEVKICEMSQAGVEDVEKILSIADADPSGWGKKSLEERHNILFAAANNLAQMRGDLIGCMSAITGKTIVEGDVEVSEAVDYARYYTTALKKLEDLGTVEMGSKGAILIISPWNFPCAIPLGGVCAALAGGNTCILKPATVAAPVAWLFAHALWEAGVPKEAFQVCITDRPALNILTGSPLLKHIILTGGTETAQAIAKANPATPLSAETGGKNAIILTASGDRDKAIMNVCASAFGNAGQKCSACSLFLVEESVYNDPQFRVKLADCATSYKVGSVWNKGNMVGPMITNNNDKLLKAINELQPGESWCVAPRFLDEKRYILAPTIKWGVKPQNYSFRTELFAPMLSVCPVKNLQEAVDLVNSLDYGLTSGLQSLDEKEQKYWKENIQAGNLYINRSITGAIVNRQPFGGMKLSAFGGGVKAGGPNYCIQLMNIRDKEGAAVKDYSKSYAEAYESEFKHARDWNRCMGEQNLFRYLPLKGGMCLRLLPGDTLEDALMVNLAAKTVGTPLAVSIAPNDTKAASLKSANCHIIEESDEEFVASMGRYARIRTCTSQLPEAMYERAAACNQYIATAKPVKEGRIELVHYIQEQSISYEYHRYGSMPVIPEIE